MQKHLLLVVFFFALPLYGACVDFSYVNRLVAPAVWHEYVAVETSEREVIVFGLPKGDADRAAFATFRASGKGGLKIERLGGACGARADEAMSKARAKSDAWQKRYRAWLPYLGRMAVTPLFGKPCRNAALDVANAVAGVVK